MNSSQNEYDRVTFSLPKSMNSELDNLKKETKQSKSELIKLAIEIYLKRERQKKIEEAVDKMYSEYSNNAELTELTSIDNESFL